MKRKHGLILAVFCAWSVSAQTLRTAGTLLVDVSADSITANDGDTVAQWANSGTLGGSFMAITNNAGVSFTNNLLGKKAVLFLASERNALTNSVATPSSMTGTSAWSVEAWVWVASLPAAKSVYLSWSQDSGSSSTEGSALMLRYDNDASKIAVDNSGSFVSFSYGTPVVGAWHHVAVVRNSFKQEKVFVDGNVVNFSWCADGTQSGFPIALGAVKKYNTPVYTNFFSGAVSRVRIHAGMLSEQDVLHNYLTDALSYSATTSTVWNSGTGNWNDSANWSNNVVGVSSTSVHMIDGTATVTNNVSPGVLNSLDIVGATLSLMHAAARVETKTPFVVGRSPGSSGTMDVALGTLVANSSVGPAVLGLGVDNVNSTLSIGGNASGSALASISQVRSFAATSAIQIISNGVLELDSVMAEFATNAPSIIVSGGTLRSKTSPIGLGQFFNVP